MTDPKIPSAKRLEHGEQIFIVTGTSLSTDRKKTSIGVLVNLPIGGAFKAELDKEGVFEFVPNNSSVNFVIMRLSDCVRENSNALAHMKVVDLRFMDKSKVSGEVAVGRTVKEGVSILINKNSNAIYYPSISKFVEQEASSGYLKTISPVPQDYQLDPKTLWRLNGMI